MSASPEFHVEIDHIRKHYDRLSFLYRLFWGEHLHHGYWDAELSPSQAQVRLMERLAERAHVPRGACVLWDQCTRMAERPAIKHLLRFTSASTRRFVQSFPLMKQA